MNDRMEQVLVAIQHALLGEVTPNLRAVVVSYDDESIQFDCYFDGDVLEENRQSMLYVETELMALFPESHRITHRVIRLDHPALIPKDPVWVYYRKEPDA